MTSTEFAARYRLLKNVATRGARSFLAQQVELGRMVMVHYLDSETPEQRSATVARLEALQPPARQKLLEIADVDGTPVAVTLFISSFVDFAMWLDSVSPGVAPAPVAPPVMTPAISSPPEPIPSDFTRAFAKVDAPAFTTMAPQVVTPPRLDPPPRAAAGEFTSIFGKVDESFFGESPAPRVSPREESLPPAPPAASDEDSEPTLIMEPVSAPKPNEPRPVQESPSDILPPPAFGASSPPAVPSPRAPAVGAAPSDEGSSFTAVFGALSPIPGSRTDLPPAMSAFADPVASERVMPPVPLAPEVERVSVPPAPPAPAPGEFTQLFQRLSPAQARSGGGALGGPPSPDSGPPPAILASPSPALPNASFSPRPPVMASVPVPSGVPMSPPGWSTPAPPASGGVMTAASSAPSEFTRILGRVSFPAAESAPAPPAPQATPTPAPAAAEETRPARSMMPLLVALNVVVLLTIAIVAYFVLRK